MESGSDKIEKVLDTLKRSKPVFSKSDEISEKVIRRIQNERTNISASEMLYEFFFGWVYIRWMRWIMVTVAAGVIIFFGFQQAVILKRINALQAKAFIESREIKASLPDNLTGTINKYKFLGKKPSAKELNVSEKEIEKLIKSINELQVRYRDLFDMIENDPELKKYMEERINKTEITKPNL